MSLPVLKALIVKNALFYGEVLSDDSIQMHAEALSDLPVDLIAKAYQQLHRGAKQRRMPLPGEVRDLIQTQPDRERDDSDDARDVAGRIVTALSRYGHTNPLAAKEFIGELGWVVVERQGGWSTLCQIVSNDEIPIYQAQWRELALSLQRRSRLGKLSEPPKLPERVGDFLKLPDRSL